MVVKPAEQTPLSALYYAHLDKLVSLQIPCCFEFFSLMYQMGPTLGPELWKAGKLIPSLLYFSIQAGVPDGVINVITGYGPTAGAAISSHMDIDKVSFTGSTEVGRLVMQAAAKSNLKPVSLELGGKNPLIVFDDADIETAANLGEICVASSRIFVQEGIYDDFAKKLAEKTKNWVVGDPFDPSASQGPQVDKKQYDKILSYIDHGKRGGAILLSGGKAMGDKGYYIEPTIFGDLKDDMTIAKDENLGLVDEAIKRANATRYGLAAGIVTNDLNVANTVSRSIRAGVIWINCYIASDQDCPYGGYKMSGFGRDLGLEAIDQYLQVKAVVTPIYNSSWL
ncbi:unnamed protein product [Ilex paraguariensis]|uniref:Aldehyde dehydrogenase domain-containing protein n=1 Tax=Ilex paraguariensis TaxID=185542 RepID=A0ABC8TTQ5_9AQUA